MNQTPDKAPIFSALQRTRAWFGLIVLVFALFVLRSFYLQIIRYDYYKKAALSDQLKQYTIAAPRGLIYAHENGTVLPLVLNQKLYTLFADPTLVKQPATIAHSLVGIIGGNEKDIAKLLVTKNTRYVILAKKITPQQSQKILAYEYAGVGTQEQEYRTYPQGALASQLLGFVDDSGNGQYGVEQALNTQLKGKEGQLKAVTDVRGVPLAASADNVSIPAQPGDNVTLTVDMGMQMQTEQVLAKANETLKAQDLSALIMDPNTGAVKAMANVPTYDPADYQDVTNPAVFQNDVVSDPIEMGSIMKTLTTSAALDQGVITKDSTFYDPSKWLIDGSYVHDVEIDGGPAEQSIFSTLNLSLNTGATWMLMQMGGGQINTKARNAWYDYMTNHFQLGKPTGIEQGYESSGYVPSPKDNGAAINFTYANTSFGQAVSATALQMGAAFSSVINGGTYYKPYLVDQITSPDGQTTTTKPKVVEAGVVKKSVGQDLVTLLNGTMQSHAEGYPYLRFPSDYIAGGKTGTAQVANPNGSGYYDNIFNGTYIGYVGGNQPQYVIVIYAIDPQGGGYAGTFAGQTIYGSLAHMLINNFAVTPKTH